MGTHTPVNRYVSVEKLADQTSLSIRTVWALVAAGRIPSIRVGRRRLIPLDGALAALERENTSQTEREPAQA